MLTYRLALTMSKTLICRLYIRPIHTTNVIHHITALIGQTCNTAFTVKTANNRNDLYIYNDVYVYKCCNEAIRLNAIFEYTVGVTLRAAVWPHACPFRPTGAVAVVQIR